jgi:hypothetical protein
VSEAGQMVDEMGLQLESGMVGADIDAHVEQSAIRPVSRTNRGAGPLG